MDDILYDIFTFGIRKLTSNSIDSNNTFAVYRYHAWIRNIPFWAILSREIRNLIWGTWDEILWLSWTGGHILKQRPLRHDCTFSPQLNYIYLDDTVALCFCRVFTHISYKNMQHISIAIIFIYIASLIISQSASYLAPLIIKLSTDTMLASKLDLVS